MQTTISNTAFTESNFEKGHHLPASESNFTPMKTFFSNLEANEEDFQILKAYKNEVSKGLQNILREGNRLNSQDFSDQIKDVAFDNIDFDFTLNLIISSKNSNTLDSAIGILTKFDEDYFEIIVEYLSSDTFSNHYVKSYLVECIEMWKSVPKARRINVLQSLLGIKSFESLRDEINDSLENIGDQ